MLSLIQLLQEPPSEQTFDCEQLAPCSDVSGVVDLVVNCLFGQTEDGSTQTQERHGLKGRVSSQPPQEMTALAYPPAPGVSSKPKSDSSDAPRVYDPVLYIIRNPTPSPRSAELSQLVLPNCGLSSNPIAGIELPCLKLLCLRGNRFMEFNLDLSLTPGLTVLDVSDNLWLEEASLTSDGRSHLVWMDFSCCHGFEVLKIQGMLTGLRIVDLSTTLVEDITDLAVSAPQLTALNLNNGTVDLEQDEVEELFQKLLILGMTDYLPYEGVNRFRSKVRQLSV